MSEIPVSARRNDEQGFEDGRSDLNGFGASAPGTQGSCVIEAPVRAQFEKPDAVLERIEQLFAHLPKIELHRYGQPREDWDAWGDEAQ